MAARGNKKTKNMILVLLPVIIVLLIVMLTLIKRIERNPEPVETGSVEPKTIIEPEKIKKTESEKVKVIPKIRGSIYLVIDDVGYNSNQLEPFLQLECPLTFAILPFLPYSDEDAHKIELNKKEYIIHMPMEPLNGEDPGPGALYTTMLPEEIRKSTKDILNSLPGAKGVNNHMGSRFTSDRKAMDIVLKALKQEGKFYLDSYTTARSIVAEMSAQNDMIYQKRDIFIDNTPESDDMKKAIRNGFTLAEGKKFAVLIGHVWSDNLPSVIKEMYREGREKGFEFRYLSELYTQEKHDESSRN